MQCLNCRSELPGRFAFCPYCGATISASGTPPPPPVYQPTPPPVYAPPPMYAPPPVVPVYVPPPVPVVYARPVYRRRGGCGAAVTFLILILVIGGVVAYANRHSSSPSSGNSPYTSTGSNSGSGGSAPEASQANVHAAAMITGATSAAAVDSHQQAVGSQSSFSLGDDVYIAITLAGQQGYADVALYRDGDFDVKDDPLSIPATVRYASFSFQINNPGQFVAAVYWCTQADCSDQQLAQVVNFSAS